MNDESPSERQDPENKPYVGDVVYMYVVVIGLVVPVLAVAVGLQSISGADSQAVSAALSFLCLCGGAFAAFEIWLANNIMKNKAWAFYVSLIIILISCLMPPGQQKSVQAREITEQMLPFAIIGWALMAYKVCYILARISSTIGPKPE